MMKISFEEISEMMRDARAYSELLKAASYIEDPKLQKEVINCIHICRNDDEDIDTCWSIVSTEYLDPIIDEPNEVFDEATNVGSIGQHKRSSIDLISCDCCGEDGCECCNDDDIYIDEYDEDEVLMEDNTVHNPSVNIINKIENEFSILMKDKEVNPDDLVDGGKIFYMNGNDGTDFDWSVNGRTCEFMMFYKETELGFAKMSVYNDGSIEGYFWDDKGQGEGVSMDFGAVDRDNAVIFAVTLFEQADKKKIWDEDINRIDFSADWKTPSYYSWVYGDDEEDEEYNDEYGEYYDDEEYDDEYHGDEDE